MGGLDKVRLGKSELQISRVGIGTAPIGSTPGWRVYWGPQNENSSIRAIQRALDVGVNWIDTAPFYGWGRAEEIVGKAIQGHRVEVYISTNAGPFRMAEADPMRTSVPKISRGSWMRASSGWEQTMSTFCSFTIQTRRPL